jgi:hypothetical protein
MRTDDPQGQTASSWSKAWCTRTDQAHRLMDATARRRIARAALEPAKREGTTPEALMELGPATYGTIVTWQRWQFSDACIHC